LFNDFVCIDVPSPASTGKKTKCIFIFNPFRVQSTDKEKQYTIKATVADELISEFNEFRAIYSKNKRSLSTLTPVSRQTGRHANLKVCASIQI
jgi:hypothetical protein